MRLETRADVTDRVIAEMNQDIKDLRASVDRTDGHITDARLEIRDSIADVKKTLGDVTTGALTSIPQWAAERNQSLNTWVGVLGGIAGILAIFCVYLLTHH